jgi:hypothetical protein
MTWRVSQLEDYTCDDRLVEMLSEREADALYEAIDSVKSIYERLLDFDSRVERADTDEQRKFYSDQCARHAILVLKPIKSLLSALNEPNGEKTVQYLIDNLPKPDDVKERNSAAVQPATDSPDKQDR